MSSPRILVCALAAAACASTAVGQVVLREDFESGAPGWTMQGICHIEPETSACAAQVPPFPSPGHCVWFGNPGTCDYSGALFGGRLFFPSPFQFPQGAGHLVMRFRRFRDAGHCDDGLDTTLTSIFPVGGTVPHSLAVYDCGFEPGWSDRRIDLSAWAGHAASIFIGFGAGDFTGPTLGYWVDDIEIAFEPGVVTCTANLACPCANQALDFDGLGWSTDTGGCRHSSGHTARLFGNGVASVANDSVDLVVRDLPPSTSLIYVQGLTPQNVVFGDGKRCFGGTAVRLAVRGITGGQDTYPHAGEPGVALKGSIPAIGGTRTYQVVYRDAASYCTPSTFNTSNGYVIAWVP